MELSKLAKVFKALSNEQRLKIFLMLYGSKGKGNVKCSSVEKGFTKACQEMNLSPSTISHHFKELENAGLISCSRTGQSITCTVNEEVLDIIKNYLK